MNFEERELVIIGGGPAGLAAAYSAYENGVKDILIIERDHHLGGILNQCIHTGFGLQRFKEELSGPEYASRYVHMVEKTDADVLLDAMVIDLNEDKVLTVMSKKNGIEHIRAKAVILAMGCRERPRGAIQTPGDRVAGIYTAGAAQKYCNIDGYLVGKEVVILGSGDIGLIMARRMTLEGAKVKAVVELCPYSNGLNRNIVQCLEDYDLPLYLSHTVTDILADEDKKRVKEVAICQVDERRMPIPGSEIRFKCDTLLLSVGLIPENELTQKANIQIDPKTRGAQVDDHYQTSVSGIFSCGNVLQVHDLVDNVSKEGERAGFFASEYLKNEENTCDICEISVKDGLSYICPQRVRITDDSDKVNLYFRVRKPMGKTKITISADGEVLQSFIKRRAVPSEMESVPLKRDLLKGIKSVEIRAEEVE